MLIEQTTLNGTTLVSFKQFINNFLNYPPSNSQQLSKRLQMGNSSNQDK